MQKEIQSLYDVYTTGQFIMDFFLNSEKLKYLKNWIVDRKKFSVVIR